MSSLVTHLNNKMKKNLNIAMIGHKRMPSREGGVEVVVEQLSTRMVRQGHQVTVFNRCGKHVCGKQHSIDSADSYEGVRIEQVFTIDQKGLAAVTSSFFATLKAIRGRFDIIHYHAEGPAAMVFIPKLFGVKTVVTIHGLDWQRAKWGSFAKNYLLFGEKMAAKFADEIVVLSENVKKYFYDTYQREVKFIPNGIEKKEILPATIITEMWGLERDSYILFLGRIVPEKGIHYLIDAFKSIQTDKKLVIAGGASDTSEFMTMVKQLAEGDSRILFTGFVQGQAMEELFSNAYLYVLPSDLEGMPLSLLEAMSYGNCCLVSDIAECTEVVGSHAAVFKQGDIPDLTSKLDQLCCDSKTVDSYKQSARDYICSKYCWNEVTERTLDIY